MIRALQYAIAALLIGAAVATLALADVVPAGDGCNTCVTDEYGRIMTCTLLGCTGPTPRPEGVAPLAFADNSKCQKCVKRCEKLYCEDVPTPAPTRSPTPPRHSFGKTCDYELKTTRTLTFDVQDEPILICHTAEKPGAFITVETTNGGNASCADFWMQMYSHTGAVSEPSQGSQPMAVMTPRVPGRYVIAVVLRQANNAACSTLTFTVR